MNRRAKEVPPRFLIHNGCRCTLYWARKSGFKARVMGEYSFSTYSVTSKNPPFLFLSSIPTIDNFLINYYTSLWLLRDFKQGIPQFLSTHVKFNSFCSYFSDHILSKHPVYRLFCPHLNLKNNTIFLNAQNSSTPRVLVVFSPFSSKI